MSAVQDINNPTTLASEPAATTTTHAPETAAEGHTMAEEAPLRSDALASAEQQPATNGLANDAAVAPVDGRAEEGLTATPAAAENTTEPITEGQLGYKGPGLLK